MSRRNTRNLGGPRKPPGEDGGGSSTPVEEVHVRWRKKLYQGDAEGARTLLKELGSGHFEDKFSTPSGSTQKVFVAGPAMWWAWCELRTHAAYLGPRPVEESGVRFDERLPFLGNAVLVGPPGVGKTLLASALHELARRGGKPLHLVDTGGLSAELVLSELFGHVKGAFSGAHASRKGIIAECEGGTLIIDEFLDMPSLQEPLLRLLQDRSYRRLGENKVRAAANVLVVLLTNKARSERELADLAYSTGQLRPDLHSRLDCVVSIPPLREQRLAMRELAKWIAKQRGLMLHASDLNWIQEQSWPGNVRQLKRVIEHARRYSVGDDTQMLRIPEFLRRSVEGTGQSVVEPPELHLAKALLAEQVPWRYLVKLNRFWGDDVRIDIRGRVLEQAVRLHFARKSQEEGASIPSQAEVAKFVSEKVGKCNNISAVLPKGRRIRDLTRVAQDAFVGQ